MRKKVINNLKKPFQPESFQDLMFFQFLTVKEAVKFGKKNNLPCMIWLRNIPVDVKLFIHQKNMIYS